MTTHSFNHDTIGDDEVRRHVADSLRRSAAYTDPAVWIHRPSDSDVLAAVEAALKRRRGGLPMPLLGLTFAVKDNIDVAQMPTTAACPDFAYTPAASAFVVQRLCDAGAIVMGKANLDQFATGLVGTRSPYGACRNVFNPAYISGGSSSGSAVAVAAGLVDFSLGTDTAGSGRVPAAFNNLVGLKPTRGIVSTVGVVPACRSLDCVSVFTRDCELAGKILPLIRGYDPGDIYARPLNDRARFGAAEWAECDLTAATVVGTDESVRGEPEKFSDDLGSAGVSPAFLHSESGRDGRAPGAARNVLGLGAGPAELMHGGLTGFPAPFRFGVPAQPQLNFFGNDNVAQLFQKAIAHTTAIGGVAVEIDYSPFLTTARLLYEGPWVAERMAVVKDLIARSPESLLPVTRSIIGGATRFSAVDAFEAEYRLRQLRRLCEAQWDRMDMLLLPTAGTIYTLAEVDADPIGTNQNLGYYTNFVNLLDLCALAVPAGFQGNGLPAGVTFMAPAGGDEMLLSIGAKFMQGAA